MMEINLTDAPYNLGGGQYDLQRALDDQASSFAPIVVNSGQVHEVSPARFYQNTVIEGRGARGLLRFDDTGMSGFRACLYPNDTTVRTALCRFANLEIYPFNAAGMHGFYLPSCSYITFQNVWVKNFGPQGDGFYTYGQRTNNVPSPADTTKITWRDCVSMRNRWGWNLRGSPGLPRLTGGTSNMNSFYNCVASENTLDGIYNEQGSATRGYHVILDANLRHGWHQRWYGAAVFGCVAETNGQYGIYFSADAETHDNTFTGVHNGGGNGTALSNASGTNRVIS